MYDIGAWSGRLTRRRNPATSERAETGGKGGNVANARRNHPSKARTATQHNVKESEATQRKATAATSGGGWRRSATGRALGSLPQMATCGDGPPRAEPLANPTKRRNITKRSATQRTAEPSTTEQSKRNASARGDGREPAVTWRDLCLHLALTPTAQTQAATSGDGWRRAATWQTRRNHPNRAEESRAVWRHAASRRAARSRAEPSRVEHSRAERSRAEKSTTMAGQGKARQTQTSTKHHEREVDINSEGRRRAATWRIPFPNQIISQDTNQSS